MGADFDENFNLTTFDRQALFVAWARTAGLTLTQIAKAMGISVAALSNLYRAETIPTRRWEQLRDLGAPVEVLPRAEDRSPGPAPKARD